MKLITSFLLIADSILLLNFTPSESDSFEQWKSQFGVLL